MNACGRRMNSTGRCEVSPALAPPDSPATLFSGGIISPVASALNLNRAEPVADST
jgi:hypothetical protein